MSDPGTVRFSRGPFRAIGRLRRNPAALGGTIVFLFFLLMAVFGQLAAPYGFEAQNIVQRLKPPSAAHLFGTDQYGRDIFSRILAGSSSIFLLSGSGTLLAAFIGVSVGLLSGFYGRLWDEALMRLLDVLLSFPPLAVRAAPAGHGGAFSAQSPPGYFCSLRSHAGPAGAQHGAGPPHKGVHRSGAHARRA